jgi:hypothetical protein
MARDQARRFVVQHGWLVVQHVWFVLGHVVRCVDRFDRFDRFRRRWLLARIPWNLPAYGWVPARAWT